MEAAAAVKGAEGVTQRDHWEAAARHGDKLAASRLQPPVLPPEEVFYLWGWALELLGRSGFTPLGTPAPLSHVEIAAFSQLRDLGLEPLEVDTLVKLDGILRGRRKHDEEHVATTQPEPVVDRWPKRKTDA